MESCSTRTEVGDGRWLPVLLALGLLSAVSCGNTGGANRVTDGGVAGDAAGVDGAAGDGSGDSSSGCITGMVSGPVGPHDCWGPGTITVAREVDIPSGATLTIRPGTTISGAAAISAMGGTLLCKGTYESPVKVFGGYILLNGGSHTIEYCIINSGGPSAIDVNDAQVTMTHVQIQRYNKYGVYVHGSSAKASIDFSTVGTTTTLFTADDATREGIAVIIDATAAQGGSAITNSVLGFLHDASNTGLKELGTASNLHLAYDYVSGTQSAIVTTDKAGVFQGTPGIADIPNLDHNLAFFAPALDLADPKADFSLEPLPNGGRANLGYHGGTPGARITSVEMVSPNGCESFPAGSMQTITWHSSPNTGGKALDLSLDDGKTWMPLLKVAAGMDTGSAPVTFPNAMTDQALIRISQDNDPSHIFGVSNKVFALGMPKNQAACAIPIRCKPGTTTCKYFKAICYEGYRDGQYPGTTEPTCAQVAEDLKILAPYTHGIRTYSSDPNNHDGKCIAPLTDMLGLDFHMGVWVDSTFPDAQNFQAIDDALHIIAAGHPSIKTLIVGNEYMLRVRQGFGDAVAEEKRLIGYITYARMKAPANVEVANAESYPDWLAASPELFKAVDRIIWHVHPWWQQFPIATAVGQVATTHDKIVAKMKEYGIVKPERLGETGYPWAINNGPAQGSEPNQAQYLKDLDAYSVSVGLEYWFFEAFDENWKNTEGPAGGKWGMWTPDRAAPPHPIVSTIATLIPQQDQWP
jgi:exo-beta-1,3-glucanase (GH17 family)